MAKITELKERNTGEVLYPKTITTNVFTESGNRLSEELENKANVDDLSNVLAELVLDESIVEEFDTLTRDTIKKDLFIDMWNTRGNYNGLIVAKYDLDNAPDTEHPFWCNKLWLSYEEALAVYDIPTSDGLYTSQYNYARTLFPLKGNTTTSLKDYSSCCSVETLRILDYYIINNHNNPETSLVRISSTQGFCHYNNGKLKEVIGKLKITSDSLNTHFYNAGSFANLEVIWVGGVFYSFRMNAPKLKLECWLYIIDNAANTKAITITVHPDIYAKLTGDTTNAAYNSLTDEEKAQWTALVTLASDKDISFATI